jgi:hypothetical protein
MNVEARIGRTSGNHGRRRSDMSDHRQDRALSGRNGRRNHLARPSRPILVSVRLTLIPALVSWALVGCGAAQGVDPTPNPEVTAADAAVRLVDEGEANLVLIVSNQSFDDEEVRLKVMVDGVTVVEGDFHVEDQHNWITFPLGLRPGGHEVTANSDSGAILRESFEVPSNKPRYAVIDYWTEDDSQDTDDPGVDLTWQFQRHAPAFG